MEKPEYVLQDVGAVVRGGILIVKCATAIDGSELGDAVGTEGQE
jgi:hypothetical protein